MGKNVKTHTSILKKNETSFKDFLFLMISGFAALFVLAFIIINPPSKTQDVPSKAEFLLIVEWDEHVNDDIDLWSRDPSGHVLSFRNDAIGLMNLEKDDLGYTNDSFTDRYGNNKIVYVNREVITIRGIQEGEYNVAVQVYSLRTYQDLLGHFRNIKTDVPPYTLEEFNQARTVHFTLVKVNPSYTEVFKVSKLYDMRGQEIHLVNFYVNEDGSVEWFDTIEKTFIHRT